MWVCVRTTLQGVTDNKSRRRERLPLFTRGDVAESLREEKMIEMAPPRLSKRLEEEQPPPPTRVPLVIVTKLFARGGDYVLCGGWRRPHLFVSWANLYPGSVIKDHFECESNYESVTNERPPATADCVSIEMSRLDCNLIPHELVASRNLTHILFLYCYDYYGYNGIVLM